MTKVISRHVAFLPGGGTSETIEFDGGFKVTRVSFGDTFVAPSPSMPPRYQPGDDGYRRAMRTIDANVENGSITAAAGRQMEEDYITESDRRERS